MEWRRCRGGGMGRRARRLRAAVCQALLASPVLARLPSEAEHARALACGSAEQFLDFTVGTRPHELPLCRVRCQFRLESVGAGDDAVPGDVRACVWRRDNSNGYHMRFGLHFRCQESSCEYLGRWHFFHQMTSVKVAHMLGIPLSEVKSAFLYWVAESWPQPSAPRLQKFLIRRDDEANATRRLDLSDPWYVLFIAFRVDSARINPTSAAVQVLRENNLVALQNDLGINFEVQHFHMEASTVTPQEASAFTYKDFQSVYTFSGYGPNETPESLLQSEVGGVAGAMRERAIGCLNPCHMVHEEGNTLGPNRCKDDCDCNGERWCSHMGLCVGATRTCRIEDITTSLAPVVSGGSGDGQGQQTGSGGSGSSSGGSTGGSQSSGGGAQTGGQAPASTTQGPLSQLSVGCYNIVIGAWQSCTNPAATGCQDLPCTVVQATLNAESCRQDICNSQVFLDRWLSLCHSNATRSAFDETVRQCSITSPPTTTAAPTAQVKETIAGGLSSVFLWVGLAALGACMSMVMVKVLMMRHKWSETSFWRGSISLAKRCQRLMNREPVVVVPNPETKRRGSTTSMDSSVSSKSGIKATPAKTLPPGTPPKMPFQYDPFRKSKTTGDVDGRSSRTPPRVSAAGLSGQSWSTAATSSPFYTSNSSGPTSPPPGASSPWPSPERPSHQKQTKEAWSPPPEPQEPPQPRQPQPSTRAPSANVPWKTMFRKDSIPHVTKAPHDGRRTANSPDSLTSGDPISPRALSKELQQVRRGATKQQLLQIKSPKSLRKELSRQREICSLAERRRLFKDLLLRWHPDKNAGDELRAAEMFQALQEVKEWFINDD